MILEDIKASVMKGDAPTTTSQVKTALEEGYKWKDILDKALIDAMIITGERFQKNEIFVPEMLITARAMHEGLRVLEPFIQPGERQFLTKMVLGTVKGDLHDIGKNLVSMICRGVGIEVVDIGIDVSPEKFVEAVKQEKPRFLGLSALLTSTMPAMEDTIKALKEAGVRDQLVVIVGGAPVSDDFAREIGADGDAEDAASCVDVIKSYLN